MHKMSYFYILKEKPLCTVEIHLVPLQNRNKHAVTYEPLSTLAPNSYTMWTTHSFTVSLRTRHFRHFLAWLLVIDIEAVLVRAQVPKQNGTIDVSDIVNVHIHNVLRAPLWVCLLQAIHVKKVGKRKKLRMRERGIKNATHKCLALENLGKRAEIGCPPVTLLYHPKTLNSQKSNHSDSVHICLLRYDLLQSWPRNLFFIFSYAFFVCPDLGHREPAKWNEIGVVLVCICILTDIKLWSKVVVSKWWNIILLPLMRLREVLYCTGICYQAVGKMKRVVIKTKQWLLRGHSKLKDVGVLQQPDSVWH